MGTCRFCRIPLQGRQTVLCRFCRIAERQVRYRSRGWKGANPAEVRKQRLQKVQLFLNGSTPERPIWWTDDLTERQWIASLTEKGENK